MLDHIIPAGWTFGPVDIAVLLILVAGVVIYTLWPRK
jgi:hypothetical protein